MTSRHFYTKLTPCLSSISPLTTSRSSLFNVVSHQFQLPLIASNLVQQKRGGTAKPKITKKQTPSKPKGGFKRIQKGKMKGGTGEAEETVSGSIGEKNSEFYKPLPAVLLKDMLPDVFMDENIGKIFKFPDEIIPKLGTFKLPPVLERELSLFPVLSLAVRKKSVELIKMIESTSETPSLKTRVILSGKLGAGKSSLLLQAVNYALLKEWIVIYISDAIKYVNSTHPYVKDEAKNEFIQPTLASELCKQIKSVNGEILERIPLKNGCKIGNVVLKEHDNVSNLLDIGINNIYEAQNAFETFMNEIGNNSMHPVLLAVDAINAFYTVSEYTDLDDTCMEPFRLSLPRVILEYFSGKRDLTFGSTVGALSHINKRYISKPLEFALGMIEASPWKQYSPGILEYTRGLVNFDVPEYTKDEAKGVMDYYHETKIINRPHDQMFERYYTSANGNPKKFYLSCCREL
ncbi:8405_t:CDS:10 [Acaulospora morrowiae]|uniref:Small ribosomal subunit protein mS29 n=1 Tax=Acaulospora morrowiae TaxID=94023 RepID=A0A9N8W1Q2_9GLOM|nr:8405_t:CDS:10 [Acaulospora morrowiae]